MDWTFLLSFTLCVQCELSRVQLCATPWTVARQAPLSMEFSRQECWSGLPLCPPGNVPHLGIEPKSLVPPALVCRFFTTEPPGKPTSFILEEASSRRGNRAIQSRPYMGCGMIAFSYTTGALCSWAWTRCSEAHGGPPGGRGNLSWDLKVVELDLEADCKMEEEALWAW